jgi:hypothetical protein
MSIQSTLTLTIEVIFNLFIATDDFRFDQRAVDCAIATHDFNCTTTNSL